MKTIYEEVELKDVWIMPNGEEKEEVYYDERTVCKDITKRDLEKAKAEFRLFLNKKGRIYDMQPYKEPRLKDFVRYFFGLYDPDNEIDPWQMATVYICENEEVAKEIERNFIRHLSYHDEIAKSYCSVRVEKNMIYVEYGDY